MPSANLNRTTPEMLEIGITALWVAVDWFESGDDDDWFVADEFTVDAFGFVPFCEALGWAANTDNSFPVSE